jgi:transcription termination factor Rho
MASGALEKTALEAKDREQLTAIASALGVKSASRAKKSELIDMILEQTKPAEPTPVAAKPASRVAAKSVAPAAPQAALGADGEPLADWEIELAEHEGTPVAPDARRASVRPTGSDRGNDRGPNRNNDRNPNRNPNNDRNSDRGPERQNSFQQNAIDGGPNRNRNRNRRRRGKGPRDEGPQGNDRYESFEPEVSNEPISTEPVLVSGYLDLRDEGYGFLRVNGYLASAGDAYVAVRLTRQYGLRKGDHVTGMCKPAGRNEKNPAMLDVATINGVAADKGKARPRFEDLTALFPDSKLGLENSADPNNMTARIID